MGDSRLGQFKTQVGWESTEDANADTFLERSHPEVCEERDRIVGTGVTHKCRQAPAVPGRGAVKTVAETDESNPAARDVTNNLELPGPPVLIRGSRTEYLVLVGLASADV